mgnify:CR=1 FL=1
MEKGYAEAGIVDPKKSYVQGGIELSCFYDKCPNIQMVSLGPTLKGIHTSQERFYIDTIDQYLMTLLHILEGMETIGK